MFEASTQNSRDGRYAELTLKLVPLLRAHVRATHLAMAAKTAIVALTQDIDAELIWAISFLGDSLPRTLKANDPRPPLLLFTDAALENDDRDKGIWVQTNFSFES